jgi:XapX domain-containing protein
MATSNRVDIGDVRGGILRSFPAEDIGRSCARSFRPGFDRLRGVSKAPFSELICNFEQECVMKAMLISFLAGLLVGVIYALMKVKSPAPPLVALAGLLGMVWGEQLLERIMSLRNIPAAQVAASPIGDRQTSKAR